MMPHRLGGALRIAKNLLAIDLLSKSLQLLENERTGYTAIDHGLCFFEMRPHLLKEIGLNGLVTDLPK